MKRVKDSAKIDISTWNLDSVAEVGRQLLQDKFSEAINEALELAMVENANIYFACEYDEAADPFALRIQLPLGPEQLIEPEWEVSIKEVITDFIEYGTAKEEPERAIALRNMLQSLVDILDKEITASKS